VSLRDCDHARLICSPSFLQHVVAALSGPLAYPLCRPERRCAAAFTGTAGSRLCGQIDSGILHIRRSIFLSELLDF
jgi:hypothetical protein